MTAISESTPVRLALVISACVAVAMISYQQGQLQARVPQDGQYVSVAVFTAKFDTVDVKLVALKDSQELRFQLLEKELARIREDIVRAVGGGHAPDTR